MWKEEYFLTNEMNIIIDITYVIIPGFGAISNQIWPNTLVIVLPRICQCLTQIQYQHQGTEPFSIMIFNGMVVNFN